MKHKCLTYLKSIGKSKALAATLSNTVPEDDFDNKDDGILNAFIATINPTDGIVEDVVEEEELVESKFEKMDDQDDIRTAYEKLYKLSKKHEKLYRLATKKLSDVELDREKLMARMGEGRRYRRLHPRQSRQQGMDRTRRTVVSERHPPDRDRLARLRGERSSRARAQLCQL